MKEDDLDNRFLEVCRSLLPNESVTVLIYADWCGHCSSLKPTWNKLETKYQNNPAVHMIKMEGDAFSHLLQNHSDFLFSKIFQHVKGYPYIANVKNTSSSDKELKFDVEEFDDDRKEDKIEKFIKTGAKHNSRGKPKTKKSKTKGKKK